METSMQTKAPLAALAAGMVLLAGLGRQLRPGEQGRVTSECAHAAPSTTTTTTTSVTTPPPATGTPPPPTEPEPALATGPVLQPNGPGGPVYVWTKSRSMLCEVTDDNVVCGGRFTNPLPTANGQPFNGVSVTSAGDIKYFMGDWGWVDWPTYLMDYQTYHAFDWTIVANEAGTTFTNDRTHHGMWVGIHGATKF